jgi:uncharacterized damage-inducible protein DinB
MIKSIGEFADYFESIRRRTLNYVRVIPDDQIEWSPKAGEMTCGALVRHLGAAEKMFVGAVVRGSWKYAGHAATAPSTLDDLIGKLQADHVEAMAELRTLDDSELIQPRLSLDGPAIKAWRFLMAMVEHEIHHRSQLAMYLMLLGIQPPHVLGLGVEDVIARATG